METIEEAPKFLLEMDKRKLRVF